MSVDFVTYLLENMYCNKCLIVDSKYGKKQRPVKFQQQNDV